MHLLGALLALQAIVAPSSDVESLVLRARAARYQQDSALLSYQAIARQRMSGGIGIARGFGVAGALGAAAAIGRERLAARFESVARVGWHREHGAWADVIAARSVAPIVGVIEPDPADRDEDGALTLPYVPGRDALWPMDELRQAFPNAPDWIVHPLASGADSVYSFLAGDSLSFRLPNGETVLLREIRVRPRRPESRLIVGSLWVDAATGNLVRAAYRPSVPVDLWPLMRTEFDAEDRARVEKFGPFLGIIREVVVEHGLYERRFWLPRVRLVSAEGTARGGRVTISMTQTFTYERVVAGPPVDPATTMAPRDVDPRTGRIRNPRWFGIEDRTDRCRRTGDDDASMPSLSPDSLMRASDLSIMYAQGVRFRVLVPCNPYDLHRSPELPASIYDDGEELFTDTDLAALRRDAEQALAIERQAEWSPQPPRWDVGWSQGLLRYNRVEGLSVGGRVSRELGSGYAVEGTARIASADLVLNAEVLLTRGNVRTTYGLAAYRRLVAANDWGTPLGLGASVNALLFARDDGFYYRASGFEVVATHRAAPRAPLWVVRLFAERQDSVPVATQESFARLVSDRRFLPNIQADAAEYVGLTGGVHFARGQDPAGFGLLGNLRWEAMTTFESDPIPLRLATDLTFSHGIGRGGTTGALTVAGGTSAGALPIQRHWFLGGPHTVRGYRAGTQSGDAFWLARGEVTRGHPMVRPVLFADVGWAGDRNRVMGSETDALAGVGAGVAALNGLLRLDVSRPLRGEDHRLRLDLYIEVR